MHPTRSALGLFAHTDDESLGCGGTLARLAEDGWDVQVVVLTDGVVTARGPEVQDNRQHCEAACKTLGLGAPILLGFPDQQLEHSSATDLSNAVFALGLEPSLIITHGPDDLNADHRITAEVARIVGRPTERPISILGCEVPTDTFWNGRPFAANYFVDISTTLEVKLDAYRCYENEVYDDPSPRSIEGLRLLAKYHGMQVGLEAAEAFQVLRGVAGQLP